MDLTTSRGLFGKPMEIPMSGLFGGWWSKTVIDEGQFVQIKYFPYKWFSKRVKQLYGSHRIERIYELMGMHLFNSSTIRIHKFFIPELVYVLTRAGGGGSVQSLIDEIIESTWIKDLRGDCDPLCDTDMTRIDRDMKVELFDWQKEFIEQYDIRRRRAHLSGELLSFGCGLGKTITSLATMKSVGCDGVLIIAPKPTLKDVWLYHLETFYKHKPKIFLTGRDAPKDAEFFIFNYEAMDKIDDVLKYLRKKTKLGIIVDESHNFLKIKSQRTQRLIELRNLLKCEHILMQSGTPIRAVGTEIIPLLRVIDGFFDEFAQEVFIKAFGVNTTLATDILHARLDMMMHRRKMEDVYTLPDKKHINLDLKVEGGSDYTIPNVKKRLMEYAKERLSYHTKRMPDYQKWWDASLSFFDNNAWISTTEEYARWKDIVEDLIKNGYDKHDKKCAANVVWANEYEKTVLIPAITNKALKDHFVECKSKIKYLDLCIQGEVLGKLENIRSEMTTKLMNKLDIFEIVNNSIKKVIFFTTYVETVKLLAARCKALKLNPVLMYGDTSKESLTILNRFRKDRSVRVLIATIQTMATGVTLTEANTVVFCNLPYRSADREQAENRVWRIGQDTECEIITVRLDTGDKLNLSDRTAEIHDWSKEMTDLIVDGEVVDKGIVKTLTKLDLIDGLVDKGAIQMLDELCIVSEGQDLITSEGVHKSVFDMCFRA